MTGASAFSINCRRIDTFGVVALHAGMSRVAACHAGQRLLSLARRLNGGRFQLGSRKRRSSDFGPRTVTLDFTCQKRATREITPRPKQVSQSSICLPLESIRWKAQSSHACKAAQGDCPPKSIPKRPRRPRRFATSDVDCPARTIPASECSTSRSIGSHGDAF